jgi:heavy metal efflux system protein
VHIEPFYDRGDLVAVTVRTVLNNMLFGVVLIFFIQWMFLGDLRSALIVSATIPAALFLAASAYRGSLIPSKPDTASLS